MRFTSRQTSDVGWCLVSSGLQPLGKMSRAHIQSGYGVLTDIQNELKNDTPSKNKLLELTNKFYTSDTQRQRQERR